MKEKKILIDLERLRYSNSGIANVFRSLASGLINITTKEYFIFLYAERESLPRKLTNNFTIVQRRFWNKKVYNYYRKFDIIHVSHQLTSYFKKKYKNQKKIVTLHDLNFLHENISNEKKEKFKNVVNSNISNADVIVCISQFVKNDLLKNWALFTFKEKPIVKVVYNGISFNDNKIKSKSFENYSFLKGKNYILNIGVLFPKKNQLSLIKMLPYIEEDLVCVVSDSKPEYVVKITEELENNGCMDRVHFLYNISDNEKWYLIENSRALCHPSLAEGFGIPPIEAMYCEKPVFLSTYTSLPEIGGDIAFYFKSFETQEMVTSYKKGIEIFDNDQSYKVKLKNRALKFSKQEMAKNYLDIYKELI